MTPREALPFTLQRLGTVSSMWAITDATGRRLGTFVGELTEEENAETAMLLEAATDYFARGWRRAVVTTLLERTQPQQGEQNP